MSVERIDLLVVPFVYVPAKVDTTEPLTSAIAFVPPTRVESATVSSESAMLNAMMSAIAGSTSESENNSSLRVASDAFPYS